MTTPAASPLAFPILQRQKEQSETRQPYRIISVVADWKDKVISN